MAPPFEQLSCEFQMGLSLLNTSQGVGQFCITEALLSSTHSARRPTTLAEFINTLPLALLAPDCSAVRVAMR